MVKVYDKKRVALVSVIFLAIVTLSIFGIVSLFDDEEVIESDSKNLIQAQTVVGTLDDPSIPLDLDLLLDNGAFTGKVVIGEDSSAHDSLVAYRVVSALESLQSDSSSSSPDYVQIEMPDDKLSFLQPLGDVMSFLSSEHLDLLSDGYLDVDSSIGYNQFINLGETVNIADLPPFVFFNTPPTNTKDFGIAATFKNEDEDIVSLFLTFPKLGVIMEYVLDFDDTADFTVNGTSLDNLQGKSIKMLGSDFIFSESTINTGTQQIEFTLLRNGVDGLLEVGDSGVFTVGDDTYEVTIHGVNSNSVSLRINGEDMILDLYETEEIDDNYVFIDTLFTEDAVAFAFSDYKLELVDNNYSDSSFNEGVTINLDSIPTENAEVRILGSVSGSTFSLSELRYNIVAKSNTGEGNIYMPPFSLLSEDILDPNALLGLDLLFTAPYPTPVSEIFFEDVGSSKYNLHFSNFNGEPYIIPLADLSTAGFKYGTPTEDLWYIEHFINSSGANHNCSIGLRDYIILTDNNPTDYQALTKVVTLERISVDDMSVTFRDQNDGKIEATFESSSIANLSGQGSLTLGNNEFTFYVHNTTAICIDLNGDGDVNGDESKIIAAGSAVLDLGPDNFPDDSGGLDSFNITLTSDRQLFEGDGQHGLGIDEVSTFQINEHSSSELNFTVLAPTNANGARLRELGLIDEVMVGGTTYGAAFYLTNSETAGGSLNVSFPLEQGGIDVYIGERRSLVDLRENLLGSFVPPGGEPAPVVVSDDVPIILDSQVSDADTSLVVIGGLCANSLVRDILEVSEDECNLHFGPGENSVKQYVYDGKQVVVIAGYGADETSLAADAFIASIN